MDNLVSKLFFQADLRKPSLPRPTGSHRMRGNTARQTTMFAVPNPGDLIPGQHPIRRIRPFADAALERLEPTFKGNAGD